MGNKTLNHKNEMISNIIRGLISFFLQHPFFQIRGIQTSYILLFPSMQQIPIFYFQKVKKSDILLQHQIYKNHN